MSDSRRAEWSKVSIKTISPTSDVPDINASSDELKKLRTQFPPRESVCVKVNGEERTVADQLAARLPTEAIAAINVRPECWWNLFKPRR